MAKKEIDFAGIAVQALGFVESFLAQELPDGKREGHEWSALNPRRADSSPGSFKINMTTGVWKDFATGEKGGDLIALYAYLYDVKMGEAANVLGERYGGLPAPPKKKTQNRKKWTPILPVPKDAPEPPKAHYRFGPPSLQWAYFDANAELIGHMYRFDRKSTKSGKQKKDFVPLVFCKSDTGNHDWRFRQWEVPRPMYGLDRMAALPDLPVLLVEGEKCADAGASVLNDVVVASWPGGGEAVQKVDFSPLKGRYVLLWPDRDRACFKAMLKIYDMIKELAEDVVFIQPPDGKAKGWDIADAVLEGWDSTMLKSHMTANRMPAEVCRKKFDESEPEKKPDKKRPKDKSGRDLLDLMYDENGYMVRTDTGDATRLMNLFRDKIRYNASPFGKWFVFDGGRWREDKTNRIFAYVDELVRACHELASEIEDKAERSVIGKHALKLEGMQRQRSIVAKAQTLQDIAIQDDEFDTHIYLFNCKNGTLDLTMHDSDEVIFRPHDPNDYMTKMSGVSYDPEADCPKWKEFLDTIFMQDEELISFIQRAVGYSLTGDISEEVMFFAYGTGANGKSVFFNTLDMLFGEYFGRAPSEMLMQQTFSQIPTDVVDLKGQRFVVCSELEENKRLYESKVKDLTGADNRIKARRMREDFIEFTPTHKLWMFGNHEPRIHGNDDGIWRRIRKIPFTFKVPPESRQPMRIMMDIFKAELDGMLNWAIEGYKCYRTEGFNDPEVIRKAVEDYRMRMDIVGQFVSACCTEDINGKTKGGELVAAYESWSTGNGEKPISGRMLYSRLREKGFEVRAGAQNKSYVYGLVLAEGAQENLFGGDDGGGHPSDL